MNEARAVPLIVHVIHRLGTGGLENGLVNIINRTPPERYRHAIVCLTESAGFARRIARADVPIVSLHRGEGHSFRLYWQLWAALRRLRPSVIHTRNLAALEAQVPAFFVPGASRLHGVHGRDVFDLYGNNRKYNLLRRTIRPLVQRYIAVSRDLARWLTDTIGVPEDRVRQIYNGVDHDAFAPRRGGRPLLAPAGFIPKNGRVIGTVGRLAAVKDQATLIRAFGTLMESNPSWKQRARLVIVGDGLERKALEAMVAVTGVDAQTWFAGDRDDVPELMRLLDIFVLPSLGEGISNTILEAMATALPVVATRVGGNPELVEEGRTGQLVPPGQPADMAAALDRYLKDPQSITDHGMAGLEKVKRNFRWDRCVEHYLGVYDELLGKSVAYEKNVAC